MPSESWWFTNKSLPKQTAIREGQKQPIEITTAHFWWNMKGKEEWFINSCITLILEMSSVKDDVSASECEWSDFSSLCCLKWDQFSFEHVNLYICVFFSVHVTPLFIVIQENGSGCLDTVGAVVVDLEGNVAAAVSSGGLAMKHPGRVGQVVGQSSPFFIRSCLYPHNHFFKYYIKI